MRVLAKQLTARTVEGLEKIYAQSHKQVCRWSLIGLSATDSPNRLLKQFQCTVDPIQPNVNQNQQFCGIEHNAGDYMRMGDSIPNGKCSQVVSNQTDASVGMDSVSSLSDLYTGEPFLASLNYSFIYIYNYG